MSLAGGLAEAQTTPTYQISAAYFQETNGTLSSFVPAGANGATLTLVGTLPTAAQQNQTSLLGCFYTGYGSTTGFPLSLPNASGTEPLVVPASTITGIPAANFTATNNYSVVAKVYLVASGKACDGTYDATLTNQFSINVTAPTLVAYGGPTSIPKTNASTGVRAVPTTLTLPALYYRSDSGTDGSVSTVTFGSLGTSTATLIGQNLLSVPVPAAFASSPAGTTASLSLCFTASPGGSYTVCTTPVSPIALTVAALTSSAGTVTSTPTPVLTSGQTVLSAQFAAATGQTGNPGAPAGAVTFVADGTTLAPAKLVLDKTASFSALTTSVTTPAAATPVITPAPGAYTSTQTITITDATQGAAIYYTQDGSTPTTASTLYAQPFMISTSQTIEAIAAVAGSLNSAVASAAYTITILPPSKLAFVVQPVNTGVNSAITPAVQVAIEDANGNVVTTATNAVTIALSQASSGTQLSGTKTVNAVNGLATFSDLAINNTGNNFTLHAISGNLLPATSGAFNITLPPITMTVQSTLVGIGSTLSGSFTLGTAAPQGGVMVNLSSSTPANATISPASVTVAAGQTTGAFTYTGVAAGNSTLSASATNYQTGTVQVTGTSAQVSLAAAPAVAPGQMVSLALSLATAAPPGGTTVTFTSSNTKVATITSSVFVPAGQQTASANPQITGVTIGTTIITASAPGYAPATRTVNVTVVATFNPGTTSQSLVTSTNTTLNISAPAQAGGITFTLKTDDATIATVTSPVTVAAGATSVPVSITGVGNGSTTIRADSTGVTEATGTVNISSNITVNGTTTGVKLENYFYLSLPVAPTVPTTVTVTVRNSAIATLSTAAATVGTTTITFTNVTSSNVGYIYVQGQSQGTTTISASAPGYTTGTGNITVDPSGFTFYYYQGNFSTTTFSSPTSLTIYTADFDPTTNNLVNVGLSLNPGIASFGVPVTSSNTTVGTIVTSPVIFHAQDTSNTTTFQPSSAGTTNLTIGTPPAPFIAPSSSSTQAYQTDVATVTTPAIGANSTSTGVNLQNSQGLYLPVAPPSPVTVTVTSNGPRIAVISSTGTVVGGTTLTFTNVSSTYIGTIYIQGLVAANTTLTISAPGYTSGTDTIAVYPTGFGLYYYQNNFSTTTNAAPSTLTIYTMTLDPTTLNANNAGLALSPGVAAVSVPVTSSNTAVGTITSSPLVFSPGDTYHQTNFQPVAAGTSTLSVGTPTGYSTPANYTSEVATVTAPTLAVSFGSTNFTTGVQLENTSSVYLSTAPSSPITVTVTSSAPGTANVSNTATTVGTTSTTFTNVTSTYVGTVYVQGQSQGSTTLTASATGYSSGTATVTVEPSGFAFYYGYGDFSTTTFSSPSSLTIYAQELDPKTLAITGGILPLNPGLSPINVPLTSSTSSVGTITTSPLVFATGTNQVTSSFKPVSAGTSTIAIGTPAGFSTPSNYVSEVATVTAPVISVNNVETGLYLQNSIYISLPQTPPNPVTVTVTSNGPQIAVISSSGTVVGGTTLTFTNVTSTGVGYIYVQGQSVGATTITVSAPGYTNGNGNVTVDPSGFTFYYYQGNFSTTTTSSPTSLTVYGTSLTPGTLTVVNGNLQLAPGFGNVSVPVTSSNTGVGTITTSPLVFTPGVSSVTTSFKPVASGSSTVTVGTPANFSPPSQYTQLTGTVQ